MIVFLTEESSVEPVLRKLTHELAPTAIEGVDWQVISFQGKADLKKHFTKKMQGWSYGNPHFIILRDNDGSDCIKLKQNLTDQASVTGKPFNIRIVCQELEAWFIGDFNAVEQAYPSSKASNLREKSKYKNPDLVNNASEELKKIVGVNAKVGRAEKIAPFLNIQNNTSHSFNVLKTKVEEIIT